MDKYLLKLICKYKSKGFFNDLRKYFFNMLKFYGTGLAVLFGILAIIIFYGQTVIGPDSVNQYFNYILPIGTMLLLLFYMFSSYTLIIFSKPDIFYLLRNKKLFKKIAIAKLIQQNICLLTGIVGISYTIASYVDSANFISVLASLLIIPCSFNFKYYLYNKSNSKNHKRVLILFLSIQLLHPNIYLILLEYIVAIKLVYTSFDNLNLERLIPLYSYMYDFERMIKTDNATRIDSSEILPSTKTIEDISKNTNKNIFFRLKKNFSFFIKDYKSIKNRPLSMNIVFLILVIGFGTLNLFFKDYGIIFYILLYLYINMQLKTIFNNNYFMLFNKVSLCGTLKDFISQTSYFSALIYLIINTIFCISFRNPFYSILFVISISISSVLTSNYNGLKKLKLSIFNFYNIVLVCLYLAFVNPLIIIVFSFAYTLILYNYLYSSIKLKVSI